MEDTSYWETQGTKLSLKLKVQPSMRLDAKIHIDKLVIYAPKDYKDEVVILITHQDNRRH